MLSHGGYGMSVRQPSLKTPESTHSKFIVRELENGFPVQRFFVGLIRMVSFLEVRVVMSTHLLRLLPMSSFTLLSKHLNKEFSEG